MRALGQPVAGAVLAVVSLTLGCRAVPGPAQSASPSPNFMLASLFAESQLSEDWNAWGSRTLQDGDVIFTMGQSRIVMGLVNFSKFSSEIADSRFSHVGIIAIEDGVAYVYDTVSGGPRRKNVGWYLARDKIERVAIKRPHLRFASHIPPAVEFCRNVYDEQVKFDERFLLEDDRYYCAEFVDLAYRRSGLPMCGPIPINQLPNFREFSVPTAKLVEWFTSISPQQAVIMPGNESMGIWSSPTLQLVLSERNPATGPPLAFPQH